MKKLWIIASLIGGSFAVLPHGFANESISGSFFNVSAIGPNLQITKTLSYPYPNVGVSIQSGFSLTNPGVDCTLSSNGQCLFSLPDATTKQVGVTGPAGNFNVKLCQNGSGSLNCQTPKVNGNRFIYVVNFEGTSAADSVYLYSLNTATRLTSGSFTAMSGVLFVTPEGVALNPSGSVIYYTDNDSAIDQIIYCAINPSTGVQENCLGFTDAAVVTSPAVIALNPAGINTAGTYAYITEQAVAGGVTKCTVNPSTGGLSSCAATTDYSWTGLQAYGITFNPTGSLAYITVIEGDQVVKCSVTEGTGALTSCAAAQGAQTIRQPTSIAINSTGTVAFIASQLDNTGIYSCPINSDTGNLDTCRAYDIASGGLFGLALASTDDMLYVTGFDTQLLYECSVSVAGVVSTPCTTVSLLAGTNPIGVALR